MSGPWRTTAADDSGLIDERALAGVLGFDLDAIRRAVRDGALIPAEGFRTRAGGR